VVVTSVIAGLILLVVTHYFDEKGKPAAAQPSGPVTAPASSGSQAAKPSETQAAAGDIKVKNPAGRTGEIAKPPVSNLIDLSASPSQVEHKSLQKISEYSRREAKLAKNGDRESAFKALQEAAQLNPADVLTHKCLAVDSAIKEYRLAFGTSAAQEVDDRLALAIANESKVREAVRQASDADAHFEVAQILKKLTVLGTRVPMIAECEKAFLDPNNDPSRRNYFRVQCSEMDNHVLVEDKTNYDCPMN
jgi:hypothetical protein